MKKLLFVLLALAGAYVAAGLLFPEKIAAWGMAAERARNGLTHKTVQIDGETWHYLEGGPQDAETVLMLHGFAGDKDNWTRFSGPITDQYHVVIPDLPGFGESARHEGWDYTPATQAVRLADFATALNLQRFHLVGNSMGGRVTGLYAHAHPEQIISMAFFCNAGVESPEPSEMEEMLGQGVNPLLLTSPDDFDRMLGFVSHKKPFIPWPVKSVMAERAFSHSDFNAYIYSQYKDDRLSGLEDKLPAASNPALILWGEHDRLLHVSSVEVMRQLLPQAEVVIMQDTGHIPMAERPAETAAHYLAFINKHD